MPPGGSCCQDMSYRYCWTNITWVVTIGETKWGWLTRASSTLLNHLCTQPLSLLFVAGPGGILCFCGVVQPQVIFISIASLERRLRIDVEYSAFRPWFLGQQTEREREKQDSDRNENSLDWRCHWLSQLFFQRNERGAPAMREAFFLFSTSRGCEPGPQPDAQRSYSPLFHVESGS